MKFLFSFLAMMVVVESCNSTKEPVSNIEDTEQVVASKPSRQSGNTKQEIVGDNYKKTYITYQVVSRGMFEYISISEAEIQYSQDKYLKKIDSFPSKSEDWQALKVLLKSVDIEHIDQLKAPTDKRLYDGAAHANLSIIKGDVEMRTTSFDHGSPPKEIEELVNKVLSIKENLSKQ